MIVFDDGIKEVYWNGKGVQTKLEKEAEAVRIYNSIKGHPEINTNDVDGRSITIPVKKGIDVQTATFADLKDYLDNPTFNRKSETSRSFVRRMMAIRFPTEYGLEKDLVSQGLKQEYQLIETKKVNDTEWVGEVGFHNKVRLDGSLDKK